MTPYEQVCDSLHQQGILICEVPMSQRIKGLYFDNVILLNSGIETEKEKVCTATEELGHHYTTAGNILDQKKVQNRKLERRARAWAYKKLVPLDKLVEAHKAGVKNRFELAEYLQVTEKFLTAALKYYKKKHGIYCRVEEYWICFEPLGVLKNIEIEMLRK